MKSEPIKNNAERNKLIAAVVLGVLALGTLLYAFGFFSAAKKLDPTRVSASNSNSASKPAATDSSVVPPLTENLELFPAEWLQTPVLYSRTSYASEAGRNIFAFYEPPPSTPFSPTPTPEVIIKQTPIKTPEPVPTPPILLGFMSPASVYSGSKGFRMEINGDKIPTDAKIIFNNVEVPTNYISPQRITADIPDAFLVGEGQRTVILRGTDPKMFSNQVFFTVQAPPLPTLQYVAFLGRKHHNNDVAELQKKGSPDVINVRLNDTVEGRFRVISISGEKVILEDVQLGFRHVLPYSVDGTVASNGGTANPNNPNGLQNGNPNYPQPYNPNNPNFQIPPEFRQTPQVINPNKKEDVDDDEDPPK